MSAGRYFYDSYAVLAYASVRETYKKYFEERDGVLTKLNISGGLYRTLEQYDLRAAQEILRSFNKYNVDYDQEDISASMKLRLDLKRKSFDISYVDALGYYLSQKMWMKFLTGDKAFRVLKGVKYVV